LFHELIVLPTVASHLARPEYVDPCPGGPVILPQPRSQQLQNGVVIVNGQDQENMSESDQDGTSEGVKDSGNEAGESDPRRFSLNVTLERIEITHSARGPPKEKIKSDPKFGPSLPLLDMSRSQAVHEILAVHNLQEWFIAGPLGGPPFRFTFKGLLGGVKGAPVVRVDDDWEKLKGQLARTTATTHAVTVIISLKDLEPYKNPQQPLLPDSLEERVYGTHVPNINNYSHSEHQTALKVEELLAANPCAVHKGHCVIDHDKVHIPLNRFRLKEWGLYLIAKQLPASKKAPDELLNQWRLDRPPLPGVSAAPLPAASTSTKRSLSELEGNDISEGRSINTLSQLIEYATPFVTPFVKSIASAAISTMSAAHQTQPLPSSPHSSSPDVLLVTDETVQQHPTRNDLPTFMAEFGKSRNGISTEDINSAVAVLEEYRYTPDIIGRAQMGRLCELTKFAEGDVHALLNFADEWNGKTQPYLKRARYST
jgi:hypothetical protein